MSSLNISLERKKFPSSIEMSEAFKLNETSLKNNSFYCQFDDVLKEYLSGGSIDPDFFISLFSNKQNPFILFKKEVCLFGQYNITNIFFYIH